MSRSRRQPDLSSRNHNAVRILSAEHRLALTEHYPLPPVVVSSILEYFTSTLHPEGGVRYPSLFYKLSGETALDINRSRDHQNLGLLVDESRSSERVRSQFRIARRAT